MPVIKSAKKKLRADKKRTLLNKVVKSNVKELMKKAKALKSEKAVKEAFKAIDKAAKKNIFHKNKAARFKSTLAKLLPRKQSTVKVDVVKETKIKAKKSPVKSKK